MSQGSSRFPPMGSHREPSWPIRDMRTSSTTTYFYGCRLLVRGSGAQGAPIRKASANARECLGSSMRLLKCARRCHWSFWYQEGFLKSHIGYLLTLRLCSHVHAFASDCRVAIDLKVKELEVFGDSMLTIFHMLKQWKMRDPKLVPHHEYLEELTEDFENVLFTYTLRMKNQFVDALATLASMGSITKENLIEPLKFEIAKGPAHCDMIEAIDGKP
ncbi:hypothetical protein CRG98_017870, partial [Punica granatum]